MKTNCSYKPWCKAQGFCCTNCTPERQARIEYLAAEDRKHAQRINTRLSSESGLKT